MPGLRWRTSLFATGLSVLALTPAPSSSAQGATAAALGAPSAPSGQYDIRLPAPPPAERDVTWTFSVEVSVGLGILRRSVDSLPWNMKDKEPMHSSSFGANEVGVDPDLGVTIGYAVSDSWRTGLALSGWVLPDPTAGSPGPGLPDYSFGTNFGTNTGWFGRYAPSSYPVALQFEASFAWLHAARGEPKGVAIPVVPAHDALGVGAGLRLGFPWQSTTGISFEPRVLFDFLWATGSDVNSVQWVYTAYVPSIGFAVIFE